MTKQRKELRKQRKELRKQRNTHDPDDMHVWAKQHVWVKVLQVLGAIAMSIGLFIFMDYALWTIRIVLSL